MIAARSHRHGEGYRLEAATVRRHARDAKGYDVTIGLKALTEISKVATTENACRGTLTYLWTDAEGVEHSTMSAIVAYSFSPFDDGKDV